MTLRAQNRTWLAVSVGLAAVTLLAYLPALRCEFINYDDPVYVTENSRVLKGLTWDNLCWAFTTLEGGFWHPLTWLSHMLDCQWFGLNAGGHHLTSVLLHAGSTVLLFAALCRMTGAVWRSASVAALFALHPLHVQSVAWIAERKDVLSTFFWMLALLGYARYAEETRTAPGSKARLFYTLTLVAFVCGLMSKTMVVTLPLVLLLLDWWPLRRIEFARGAFPRSECFRLAAEKLPLFLLATFSVMVTIHAEKRFGAFHSVTELPLTNRVANAIVSCARYLTQMMWPTDLAAFYPYPKSISLVVVTGAGLFLLACSIGALWAASRRPYWAAGWFWYLVTLSPVAGLLQVGDHARADRYTYIPLIGVFLALVWGAGEMIARWRMPKGVAGVATGLVLTACTLTTQNQLRYWQNSELLFRHAFAVTKDNDLALFNIGCYLDRQGRVDDAMNYYRQALELNPANFNAHNNLGAALERQGNRAEAIRHYREALRAAPDNAEICNNLGVALARSGELDEAMLLFVKATRLAPDNPKAQSNLGNALAAKGQTAVAISHYRLAVQIDPDYDEAHNNLANALAGAGNLDEAITHYRKAIQINSNYANAYHGLGAALVRSGNLDAAVESFTAALRLEPNNAGLHNDLGAALALGGKPDEAIHQYAEALRLSPDYADAANNLGNVLFDRGRFAEAADTFRKSLELQPDRPEAHFNLGRALAQLGQREEAVKQLQAVLRLKPDYTPAKAMLKALGAAAE